MEDFSSTPLNYGFYFWISSHTSLELVGGFESIDMKDNSGTSYNIGLGGFYHLGNNKIIPFIGSRFLFTGLSADKISYSDLLVGIAFGAEYFFSDQISLGGEFQLNYIETDEEFSPSGNAPDASIFKTTSFIILRFYL
jgi:hypothetical protein